MRIVIEHERGPLARIAYERTRDGRYTTTTTTRLPNDEVEYTYRQTTDPDDPQSEPVLIDAALVLWQVGLSLSEAGAIDRENRIYEAMGPDWPDNSHPMETGPGGTSR